MNEALFIPAVLALAVVLWIKRRSLIRHFSRRKDELAAGTSSGKQESAVGPFHCPACKHTVFIDKSYTQHSNLITCPYCGRYLRVPKLKFNLLDPTNGIRNHLKNRTKKQEPDQDK